MSRPEHISGPLQRELARIKKSVPKAFSPIGDQTAVLIPHVRRAVSSIAPDPFNIHTLRAWLNDHDVMLLPTPRALHHAIAYLVQHKEIIVVAPGGTRFVSVFKTAAALEPSPDQVKALQVRNAGGWRLPYAKAQAAGLWSARDKRAIAAADAPKVPLAVPIAQSNAHETKPRERPSDVQPINPRRLAVAEPGPCYFDAFGSRKQ
jgi:hypothetical protein